MAGGQGLHVAENGIGALNGADHNGYIGFLGDLKNAATEGVQKMILTAVAFRKNTNGDSVLFQQGNAL